MTANFDIDEFVHATGAGGIDPRPAYSDAGAIDVDALGQVAPRRGRTAHGRKLTRKEKKAAKRDIARREREAKDAEKNAKRSYKSIKSQLKDRDKELSDKTEGFRRKREAAKTVTDYIGYNRMYQDGICEVEEGLFSSSIAFDDTSYHSVRDEQQKAMFSALTRLYDQFGANTLVQMSVVNTPLLREEVGHRRFFNPNAQSTDAARHDAQLFNDILNDKVKEGVSNIRRNRYLTYSVSADNAEDAARQLSRIETESSRILNSMGSKPHLMNGTQRLRVIHSLLNPYKPFYFDYQRDISARSVQTTKDCIAPTQIDFKPDGVYNDCFQLDNGVYGQVLVMKKFGSELSDRALADIVDLPIPMEVTWYVQPMDKSKAINFVRSRSAWIDKEIIEEQRSAVNKGYDFSILPQELKYSKEETEDVLDHLQNKNQRLYVFTGLIYTYAPTKEQLDQQVMRIISVARQSSIEVDTYDYRQRRGLNSILPLGHNHVEISRMFTTAQVAILVPFATQELDDKGGNYYGQNKHSRNLVICNRKRLTSPMGFVCGKTGSGKGMFVKTEMTGTIFTNPTDEIYVIDRAGEYTAIADRYGGTTYHFGVGTGTYLNPFDTVSVEHLTRSEQIAFKIDAMLAQAGASAAESGQSPLRGGPVHHPALRGACLPTGGRARRRAAAHLAGLLRHRPRAAGASGTGHRPAVRAVRQGVHGLLQPPVQRGFQQPHRGLQPEGPAGLHAGVRPHQRVRGRAKPHVLQRPQGRAHMAVRGGDAEHVRLPDRAQLLQPVLQRGPQIRPAPDRNHPERGGDAQQQCGTQHCAERRLPHAPEAVPSGPHEVDGTAEPVRAGGGVHRRERGGGRRPADRRERPTLDRVLVPLRKRSLRPVEHQPQRNQGQGHTAQVSHAGKGR